MKILVAHNFYQMPGGEDLVFSNEKKLLTSFGHDVIEYVRHNRDIADPNLLGYATLPARTIWNWESYSQIKRLLLEHRPDVAHFHNIFPLISPAAYTACWECDVPIVQSLHNSRLICPGSSLYYGGKYCQDCLGRTIPWPGILRACYRKSHLQTGLVGIMTALHRSAGTWHETVSRYVVFSAFFRQKFMEAGFPGDKLAIKPHFTDDPGIGKRRREYALYVGRLTGQKGLSTLLRAIERLKHVPLKICGSGNLEVEVRSIAERSSGQIELLPYMPHQEVMELMKGAAFLVWPSEITETFGLVALEAFACGVPVISSGVGAMPDLVGDMTTGLSFKVGDAGDLSEKIEWAWDHPEFMDAMGRAARAKYESYYTASRNHDLLMQIYSDAIEQRKRDRGARSLTAGGTLLG